VFGSAIHSAMEFFFSQQLAGEEESGLDELLAVYQQSWRDRSGQAVRFGKTETADSMHQLADRMLTAFLASDLTKQEGRIIGIEEELRGELSPELPDLLGRIDLLLETDDAVVVQDFKTSRSAWNEYQAEDQSEQLLLYADLVRRLIPGKQLRLQFAVITKAKAPKVQLLEANFDESKLDRTKRVFENVWSAIQAGHFYPVPSPMQCPGCGFLGVGGVDVLWNVDTQSADCHQFYLRLLTVGCSASIDAAELGMLLGVQSQLKLRSI